MGGEEKLGTGQEMQDRLSNLVAIFEDLDFRGSKAEGDDLLGDTGVHDDVGRGQLLRAARVVGGHDRRAQLLGSRPTELGEFGNNVK